MPDWIARYIRGLINLAKVRHAQRQQLNVHNNLYREQRKRSFLHTIGGLFLCYTDETVVVDQERLQEWNEAVQTDRRIMPCDQMNPMIKQEVLQNLNMHDIPEEDCLCRSKYLLDVLEIAESYPKRRKDSRGNKS